MLKNLLMKMLLKQLEEAIKSGKISEILTELLMGLLKGDKLSITVEGSPVNNTLKDLLLEALLNIVRDLLASGKLNDLILKLLQGLLGSKTFSLPLTTTTCGDVEVEGSVLAFTHDDGTVYRVDFSELLN